MKWPVREMVSISPCINFLSLMCVSIDAFNWMRLEESSSNHTGMPDLTEVWPLRSQQYRTIGFGLKKKNIQKQGDQQKKIIYFYNTRSGLEFAVISE